MAVCGKCDAQVPDGTTICPNCFADLTLPGAVIEQPEAPQTPPVVQDAPAAQPQTPEAPQAAYAQPANPEHGQTPDSQYAQATYAPPAPAEAPANDSGSVGWGVLGAFFPIVGLILYFVWRKKKPNNARVSITGACIGVAISIIYNFLMR